MSGNDQVTFPLALWARLRRASVLAVVVLDDLEAAVPVVRTLLKAGVEAMELAMRTLASTEAPEPSPLRSPGTRRAPERSWSGTRCSRPSGGARRSYCHLARAGASSSARPRTAFPSPRASPSPPASRRRSSTARRLVKFLPAEPLGGLAYLETIDAPYAHLGLEYIPLGGVSEANCRAYLAQRSVIAIGGSWLAPRERIAAKDRRGIGEAAARAVATCRREDPHA